jgi:hypothetical protein
VAEQTQPVSAADIFLVVAMTSRALFARQDEHRLNARHRVACVHGGVRVEIFRRAKVIGCKQIVDALRAV